MKTEKRKGAKGFSRPLAATVTLAMAAGAAVAAFADSATAPLTSHTMYGISASDHSLRAFNFDNGQATNVGPVTMNVNGASQVLKGIEATAYTPTHMNLYGFWTDPTSGLVRLVYINTKNAKAAVVGQDLGDNPITGAVSVMENPDTTLASNQQTPATDVAQYGLYAMQITLPPVRIQNNQENDFNHVSITGECNINPNNSAVNEFTLVKPDGDQVTRDDLHSASDLPDSGVYYQGSATSVRFKPKGNGDQNTLVVGGVQYALQNNTTYQISGPDLSVKVYNDHTKNGKAMGQWYLAVGGSDLYIDEGADNPTPPNPYPAQLIRVDPATGEYTVVMKLNHPYASLAAMSADHFYAAVGENLYFIDVDTKTETLVGSTSTGDLDGLEAVGSNLYGFSSTLGSLLRINTSSGEVIGSPINVGAGDLHTITFMRNADVPQNPTYD